MNVLILNGPNLNLLGTREPAIYGSESLDDIRSRCAAVGESLNIGVAFKHSNSEGQLVDWIQDAGGSTDAIILNAAAYSHTSIAIHDALKWYSGYKVELHISHPHSREAFRHNSYVSSVVDAVIAGFGTDAYPDTVALLPDLLTTSART